MTEKKFLLEEMTWVEAKEFLPKVKVAIVPVGSTEQHGYHLPMHVDHVAAVAVAKRTAEKLYPEAIVTPSIPIGVGYHHLIYPGSLTLSEDTLAAICYDVAASLKHHGVPFIFFLDGHWGNKTALALATRKIRWELKIKTIQLCYWDFFPMKHKNLLETADEIFTPIEAGISPFFHDHAGEWETSIEMHLRNDLVHKDRLKRDPDARARARAERMSEDAHRKNVLLLMADDQTPLFGSSKEGVHYGTAEKATAEKGRKIIEICADEIAKFLRDLFVTYTSIYERK